MRIGALSSAEEHHDADVVLMCFATDSPDSLDKVKGKVRTSKFGCRHSRVFGSQIQQWYNEVRRYGRKPIILVRLKKDRRIDAQAIAGLAKTGQHPVTYGEVRLHGLYFFLTVVPNGRS